MNGVLDRIDRGILEELEADGRLSIVELALRVNLTNTPCFERVNDLKKRVILLAIGQNWIWINSD